MKTEQLYRTIQAHYLHEIELLRANLRTLADVMSEYADHPQDIAFQHAAKMYKKTKAELEEAESVARALAEETERTRFIVTIRGGQVTAIYSDSDAVDVDVVDFDCCADGEDYCVDYHASVAPVIDELENRKDLICVW